MKLSPCFSQLIVMFRSACLNWNGYSDFDFYIEFLWRVQVSYFVKCFLIWTRLMFPHDEIQIMHFCRNTPEVKLCPSQYIISRDTCYSSSHYWWLEQIVSVVNFLFFFLRLKFNSKYYVHFRCTEKRFGLLSIICYYKVFNIVPCAIY